MSRVRLAFAAVAVSLAGLGLIGSHEGTVYQAYADPAYGWALPTICKGHTAGVKRGDTATPAQCDAYLREDVRIASDAVLRLTAVPLTQGELDAYTSFVFNVGAGNFAKSTLRTKLNNGQHLAACDQLLRWDYANGKKLRGLTTRRSDERTMCRSQLVY